MAQRRTILLAVRAHYEEIFSILNVEEGRALRRDRAMWFATCASDGAVGDAGSCAGGDSIASLAKSSHPLCLQCDAIYRAHGRSGLVCSRLCFGGHLDIDTADNAHTEHIERTGTEDDAPLSPSPCAGSAKIPSL